MSYDAVIEANGYTKHVHPNGYAWAVIETIDGEKQLRWDLMEYGQLAVDVAKWVTAVLNVAYDLDSEVGIILADFTGIEWAGENTRTFRYPGSVTFTGRTETFTANLNGYDW